MNTGLEDLKPKALWKHFQAIAAIPRASGKEAAARAYVLAQAERLGLKYEEDGVGNIIVRKPASKGREGAPTAALQGHLDMVCEKNEGTAHNFDTDPIRLVRDGDWLKADGTTLGADNGGGVAAALAMMESEDVAHGPLEFVFTVDEESGLTGASEFPSGVLRAKYFLNLDGEEEGTLCIGCAGGLNTVARKAVERQPAPAGEAWRIKVSGLQGGHSGLDINKGRGNALRVVGRVLETVLDRLRASVAEVQGGSKHNAIPREAFAIVVVKAGQGATLESIVSAIEAEVRSEFGAFDPDAKITVESVARPVEVISAADALAVTALLTALPHGMLAMSPDVPGLVQTSTNLATLAMPEGAVEFGTSQRSSIESSKLATGRMVATVFGMAGFEVRRAGGYPGWKPEPKSEIVQLAQAVHKDVLGSTPELVAMHAGLECGVIGEKHPGMQMLSFGPHIVDVHSPSERLKISSVEPFWRFLTALLERV